MTPHLSPRTVPGTLRLDARESGECLVLAGDWTLEHYANLAAAIRELPSPPRRLDCSALGELDTAGAALLVELEKNGDLKALADTLPRQRRALLLAVYTAMNDTGDVTDAPQDWLKPLIDLGKWASTGWRALLLLLGFMGLTLSTFVSLLGKPRRWRLTALVAQIHQTGLNAVAIVALLTFLVGAVIAFLGATVLSTFGATIYTVDLVAYSFLREFAVVLAAVLLAGRTASAFTAQIGSMKVNEELDAMQAMGLDAIELLVLPRILALVIVLPLLTFLAMLAGLAGGAAVALLSLDIPLTQFYTIVGDVPLRHFLVGLSKAPIFAMLIALIGCLEGFKVAGSAESVGAHTTSSVVQSIFAVILVDSIAAIFFMEMGW